MTQNYHVLIDEIVNEWIEFAENMGSTYMKIDRHTILINKAVKISCDFANFVISSNEMNYSGIIGLGDLFKTDPFSVYYISQSLEKVGIVRPTKYGSIMYLSRENWTKYGERISNSDCQNNSTIRIIQFSENDVAEFADIVFDAFGYESQYREDSIASYRNGLKSGSVIFYGLIVSGTFVSCLLLHKSERFKIAGLELVSTKRAYQSRGFSKILLKCILNKGFKDGLKYIWLFSIKGSIAEDLYSKLGFKTISNIYVFRISQSRELI